FQLLPAFLGVRGRHEAATRTSRGGRVEDPDLDVGRKRPEALSRSAIAGTTEIAVELGVGYRQQVASRARGEGARRLATFRVRAAIGPGVDGRDHLGDQGR